MNKCKQRNDHAKLVGLRRLVKGEPGAGFRLSGQASGCIVCGQRVQCSGCVVRGVTIQGAGCQFCKQVYSVIFYA